ncbi:hypothetical protein AB0D56_30575 [Streptomyces sp. NPDC048209]
MSTDHAVPVETPDDDAQPPAGPAAPAPQPVDRPHEPGARPAPLSRLLYP